MADWFNRAFGTVGKAVAEARHELIDRGWFGRMHMPNPTGFPDRSPGDDMPSPDHLRNLHDWFKPDPAREPGNREPDPSPPSQEPPDHGIDR